MINILFSRICILAFGTLYPGYISFKTVRAKIAEDYLKWMMYWIVFAIFTASETFTDIFLQWLPFYYEAKVALILWLLPTMGNGSSFVYKKCIHPLLKKHETRVDWHLNQVREQGQELVLRYIKEAALYITKSVVDIINRNVPNNILGVMANTNSGSERSLPVPNITIEEIDEQEILENVVVKAKNRRPTMKTSSKTQKDAEDAQTSRGRVRKTRNSKPEIDIDFSDS